MYTMMILILCSSMALRNFRLFDSHRYLERGVYSLDRRVMEFSGILSGVEEELDLRFATLEEAMVFFRAGRSFPYKNFTISLDPDYNGLEVNMLKVVDNVSRYARRVEVLHLGGVFLLVARGV
ncbi:hypothetical protein KCG48_01270 [Proteiniclasticum sp. BAD-10]|uniref:Uncharacterized protein n=1 Tax=Proteiniclasticum sediminis TaxID=2804028 RepID=A0A941HNZ4_9CLOT|nr:hypothetical protein [Proteiniclasticum sediminis]MBR0574961.1 hypothetical protein [Proteiniclasticum sediminis]